MAHAAMGGRNFWGVMMEDDMAPALWPFGDAAVHEYLHEWVTSQDKERTKTLIGKICSRGSWLVAEISRFLQVLAQRRRYDMGQQLGPNDFWEAGYWRASLTPNAPAEWARIGDLRYLPTWASP